MDIVLEEVSTITAKGQTTIPKSVRQALGVDYGGRIAFRVGNDSVTVARVESDEDPAIEAFLGFLVEDIKRRPEAVKALAPELVARITALTDGIDVDPDAAIDGDVAL